MLVDKQSRRSQTAMYLNLLSVLGIMGKFFLSILAFLLVIMATYFAYQVRVENKILYKDGVRELENGASLEWQECWFSYIKNVECARLHTAPEKKGGKSAFSLPVVVIRNDSGEHYDDPVVYMAGGPGASAWLDGDQVKDDWVSWYKKAKLDRDFIIFDQRGAGLSEPKLSCPEYYDALRTTFSDIFSKEDGSKIIHDSFLQCQERLKTSNQPINEISTLHSVADVNDLMTLLGYDEWNLHAVSYSTRLALMLEQTYPEKVRSMVLDSVYPIQRHFFKEWPELMKESLERIIRYCDKNGPCKENYGDQRQKIWATVAMLRDKPMKFMVEKKTYGIEQMVVDDDMFLSILFDSQYESGALYELPRVIHAFFDNDLYYLQPYIEDYLTYLLDDSISEVVFWMIECKDNPPLSESEELALYSKYPKIRSYLNEKYDSCDIWLNNKKPKGLQVATNQSDIPVMVFGGEDDPVTPADWSEDLLKRFQKDKMQMFRFLNISHSVMDSKRCGIELFSQFIHDPLTRPMADCRINRIFDDDLIELTND
jgi:pimeloyl-ACP methyl ester carboxylesterase